MKRVVLLLFTCALLLGAQPIHGSEQKQLSLGQETENFLQSLKDQVKDLLQEYINGSNAQIKTLIEEKKINLGQQKVLDELYTDITTKGAQLIKVINGKNVAYFKNRRIAREFVHFAQDLANIYAELEKIRETTFHLLSRYVPIADIKHYYNDLDSTYRSNFKNFPDVDYQDVYATLDLHLKDGIALSNRTIRDKIKSMVSQLGRPLVRQLDFIFRNDYTKETYDAYARNALKYILIGEQAKELLVQKIMPIAELKDLVHRILKALAEKKVIEWSRPY